MSNSENANTNSSSSSSTQQNTELTPEQMSAVSAQIQKQISSSNLQSVDGSPIVVDVIDVENPPTDFVKIRCRICNSLILLKENVSSVEIEKNSLPESAHCLFKSDETNAEFWLVKDMFKFENIGFLKTVENVKFMSCADCEKEILGVHVTNETPKRYLIRKSKLKYV